MGTYDPSGDQLVQQSRQAVTNTKQTRAYGNAVRSAAQTRNDTFAIPGGSSVSNPGAGQSFAYSPGSLQAFGTNSQKAFG